MHNLFANMRFEAGNEEIEGHVVETVLNAKIHQIEKDPGTNVDGEGHELRDIRDFLPGSSQEALLVEFL